MPAVNGGYGMRRPKRPGEAGERRSLEEVLAALKSRPAFGSGLEWEALESGGFTILITRLRKPVFEALKEWEAAFEGYTVRAPEQGPDPKALCLFRVERGGERWEFYASGTQAYTAAPAGAVRALLEQPHDFLPKEVRVAEAYRALALRVHLAGGSDQWVSRAKLEKFLASGRDGPLTGLDWGLMPE